jgi:hypothetical protein
MFFTCTSSLMAKVKFYLGPKDHVAVPPARSLARNRGPSESEPAKDDDQDEETRRQAGIEARKRLARDVDPNGVNILWVPDDRWTTIRTAPADGIKLEARSIKVNGLSQVNLDNPAIIEELVEHAEHEIGDAEPCTLFWTDYRFSKM